MDHKLAYNALRLSSKCLLWSFCRVHIGCNFYSFVVVVVAAAVNICVINKNRRQWRYTESQDIEQRRVAMGDGELWVATKRSQMPGKEEPSKIPWG